MITIAVRNDTMDVRDLQVFLSVAKHLNFTRAGEEVHLSQPSVSVRMRQSFSNTSERRSLCMSNRSLWRLMIIAFLLTFLLVAVRRVGYHWLP